VIYRGAVPVGAVASTSFTDQALVPATAYTYRVVAFDYAHNYSAYSGSVNATTNALPDHMYPGEFLLPGQFRQSADGRFVLVYQGDGNLVLYQGSNPLWNSETQSANPGIAVMQGDSNFVVYDSTGPVWWSHTWGVPGAYLVVQNDGNTVIYSPLG
jgi:hypothetical protein